MQLQHSINFKAPLLSWDIFSSVYNTLIEDAANYRQSVSAIREIARINKWSEEQTGEAIEHIQRYVIVITDSLQKITYTGKGFYEMTGYTFEEARGKNPRFLQGSATNKRSTFHVKEQLALNATAGTVLENYRKNGEMYLCKIIIKPITNYNQQLVNYIAYEQEVAA